MTCQSCTLTAEQTEPKLIGTHKKVMFIRARYCRWVTILDTEFGSVD